MIENFAEETTHLHQVVLAGGHVVVVGVEQLAVLLKELLCVVNCALDQRYQLINVLKYKTPPI